MVYNSMDYYSALSSLYPDAEAAKERYANLPAAFERLFGTGREITFISAPGRTEIGGNHTDHQRGRVLAAAVNLDVICAAAPNSDNKVNIISEGHRPVAVDLSDLNPRPEESGRASALIRGIAAWFRNNGCKAGGLDAYTTSQVLSGSGLSSSAAFETAAGCMFNHLYNSGTVSPEQIAMAGQYAENVYYGKQSGLMDQMVSALGGCVKIEFADPKNPVAEPVAFDPDASGYTLCVVDTKSSHAGHTDDYAAIPAEMRSVAEHFGKLYLSEVEEGAFYAEIPRLRDKTGDRAVLRAMHFFDENARVGKQAQELKNGDIKAFLKLVTESGESSFTCLQNIYANPLGQGLTLALALSRRVLANAGGAWRVHGGGFAGTIQTYVPHDILPEYRAAIEGVFGVGACRALKIRQTGGIKLFN